MTLGCFKGPWSISERDPKLIRFIWRVTLPGKLSELAVACVRRNHEAVPFYHSRRAGRGLRASPAVACVRSNHEAVPFYHSRRRERTPGVSCCLVSHLTQCPRSLRNTFISWPSGLEPHAAFHSAQLYLLQGFLSASVECLSLQSPGLAAAQKPTL